MPPLSLKPHRHNGVDSDKLYLGNAVQDAPQEALTATDTATLSSGGSEDLKSSDSDVIDNIRTRVDELETKLQRLGLLK